MMSALKGRRCQSRFIFPGLPVTARHLLAGLLAAIVMQLNGFAFAEEDAANILLINSYHAGYRWSDQIVGGIRDTLATATSPPQLFIEYLDSKRIFSAAAFDRLADLIGEKYRHMAIAAVIVGDDNGLAFLKRHRQSVFAGIPAVFCGANDLNPAELEGMAPITGVNETADVRETIQLALDLAPGTRRIVVVNDTTPTGRNVHREIDRVSGAFADRLSFVYWEALRREDLLQRLSGLKSGDIVLYTFFFRDSDGHFYEYDDSARKICAASAVPVFGLWEFNLGYGIVGGKLVSGYEQGVSAGQMTLRILGGEKADAIPLKMQSPNRFAFDYQMLAKFGLDASRLPAQSLIINQPTPIYQRYKAQIWVILVVFLSLLSLSLFLLVLIGRGRSERERLRRQQQFLGDLTGNLPSVVFQFYASDDGRFGLNYVNEKAVEILELNAPLETAFTIFSERIHEDDQDRFTRSIDQAIKHFRPWHFEGRYHKPSGDVMWLSGSSVPHKETDRIVFDGMIIDITEIKTAEEKLRTSARLMSQIVNFLPDPTFVIDHEKRLIAWNRAMETLTGVGAEEMLGKGNFEYAIPFYGERRPTMIDLVSRWDEKIAVTYINLERKGDVLVSETVNPHPRLRSGIFRNVAGPLYDDDGKIIGAIESIHDITSRRRALQAMKEREELLVFFVAYTPVAVAMCDQQMKYLHYSRRWITDFGLPDEDLTGRSHYDVFGPIPDHWKIQHQRCLQGESFQNEEESFIRADGSVEWVRRTLYPWRTHEDQIGGLIILVEVTTGRKRAEQAAREMENRLQAIGENLPGGLIFQSRINPDGTRPFTYVSGNVKRIFGYTVDQVMSDETLILDRVAPEDLERMFCAEAEAIRTFSVMDEVVEVKQENGLPGWHRVVAKPKIEADGTILLDGIIIDITALKQAEAYLRLMAHVVKNSPVVLFRWRAEANWPVVFVSDNVRQFGYTPDELLSGSTPFASLIHPDDLARVTEEVRRYSQQEVADFTQEYRLVTRDGDVRWVDDRTVIERDAEGHITHYQGVVLDISERKRAQEEINTRQQFLESVLYHAPDAIIVLDANHRVIDWNPGAEKIFGYTRDEVLGRELDRLVSREATRVEAGEKTRRVLSGERVEAFETVRYRKDGSYVNVIAAGSPIMVDGTLTGVVVMYTDVTALKQAEDEVKRNERMLRRIMDMVPSMIFVKNAEGRFLMANQAVAESYGMSVEALVGRLQSEVHPDPDQARRYLADDRRAMQSGKAVFIGEEPYQDKTGATRWLEVIKLPCDMDDFGEPAVVGLSTDITSRRETEARIQESENRYRTMFENTGTGTVLSEADTTLSMVNREFAQMVGYTRKEIEGKMSWTQFIAPEDIERMKGYHDARRKDPLSAPTQWECRLVDRTGKVKPMLLKVRLIPGTQTSIGAFLDISDRKRAEEALVAVNRMLRLVLDTIPVRVFWKDTACRYLGCNQPFAEDAGFSNPESLIGRDDYELVWVNEAPMYRRDDRAVMDSGMARINFEEPQTTPDGRTIWLQTSKVPMRDAQENIIGVLGTYQDITERKHAIEELQRLRNYLTNIINSMPSALVGVDTEGRVTQWNKQAELITGVPLEKARLQPLANTFPQLEEEMARIQSAIKDRQVIRNLKIPRPHEGEIRFEDITIFPLVANGVEGAVIRVDDVTERVRLEEMMIQSEKMLSVGGLAAGMAHEINNPLAGILQNTAVLESRLLGDLPANRKAAEAAGTTLAAVRHYMALRNLPDMLENIRTSGNRAAAIVKNMLSFARKSDRIVSSHDLAALLDQTLELARTDYDMKKHYDFKQIQIVREYDQAAPPVPCEASKVQQVFLNILKNGAEAMAEGIDGASPPTFFLRVRDDGPWVCVEIQDNGPGMDEATRRRIFEPFFTTKPVGRGTGLGLSVSYFIITENHGGKMDAHVGDGGGTRFTIRLPKAGKA